MDVYAHVLYFHSIIMLQKNLVNILINCGTSNHK